MKALYFLIFSALVFSASADISHPFKACQAEDIKKKEMCTPGGAKSGIDNLRHTVSDLEKTNQEYQFKNEMKTQVAALIDLQIKKNQSLAECFRGGAASYCSEAKAKSRASIQNGFTDMKISLALSSPRYQEDRILNEPATQYDATPKHLINMMAKLPALDASETKKTQQIYREQVATKKLNITERREFQKEMKILYFRTLGKNPILGYVTSSTPADHEISAGFVAIRERLIKFQKEVFKKGGRGQDQTDWDEIFQFREIAEEILRTKPELCAGALKAWYDYTRSERFSRAGEVLVAFGAGFSCLLSTPVCLIAGLGVGGYGVVQADQRFENEVASALVQPELANYAKLSDAERAAWVEKVMLPTVFLGVGKGATSALRAAKSTMPYSAVENTLLKTGLNESERISFKEVTKKLELTNDAVVHLASNLSTEDLKLTSRALSKIHQGEYLSRDEAVQVSKFLEDASAKGLLNFHLTKLENLQKIQDSGMMHTSSIKTRIFTMSSRTESGQYFKMGSIKGFGEGEVIFQGEAAQLFKNAKPTGAVGVLHRAAGHQVTQPGKLIIEEGEMREGVLIIKKARMQPLEKADKIMPIATMATDVIGAPIFITWPSMILPYRYEKD